MLDDMFSLTQVPSRYQSFSLQDTPREVTRSLPSLKSPKSIVQNRLDKAQNSIKRNFDALYTVRREKLLPKAMEIERSSSVQDQLRTLETHVVAQTKVFNDLQNRRKAKETLLLHLQNELKGLLSNVPDLSPFYSSLEGVERQHQYAQHQLYKEFDYKEVLQHMLAMLSKELFQRQQPIYGLRKELQQLKIRLHEGETDALRVSLESQSLWTSIHRKKAELVTQTDFHQLKLQDKIAHFRKRAEFVEFYDRQVLQKDLESQINRNNREIRALYKEKWKAEKREERVGEFKKQQDALHEYERQAEVLIRAASTGNVQAVLTYWAYLQDYRDLLQTKVQQESSRSEELRQEVGLLRQELTETVLGFNSEPVLSKVELSGLERQLGTKEKDVSTGQSQLQHWDEMVASVYSRLEALCSHLGGSDREMSVTELLGSVEELLVARLTST